MSTSPEIARYLDELVRQGLHGQSRADAADRIIAEGIRRLMEEGTLDRRRS